MTMRGLGLIATSLLLVACESERDVTRYGSNPDLPKKQGGLIPSMTIADPAGWGDRRPVVPEGFTISAIATDLKIPRQTLVLPNGDILVAEARAEAMRPS